jgi:hypothetical protein
MMQTDTEHDQKEYYITVRFKVRAESGDVARDQIKRWLLGIHAAISKYKSLYLPAGVNRVFEMASEAQEVEE